MNNEFNSNTRTLIVSFAIAIMFLIPLRFVEVGNIMSSPAMVLGDTTGQEIVLPNDKVEGPMLEAPYAETEAMVLGASTEAEVETCLSEDEASKMITEYSKILEVVKENELQTSKIVEEILAIEKNTCK